MADKSPDTILRESVRGTRAGEFSSMMFSCIACSMWYLCWLHDTRQPQVAQQGTPLLSARKSQLLCRAPPWPWHRTRNETVCPRHKPRQYSSSGMKTRCETMINIVRNVAVAATKPCPLPHATPTPAESQMAHAVVRPLM